MKYFCYDTAINGVYTLLLLKQEYPEHQCLFHETKDAAIWDVAPWLFATENNVYEQIKDPLSSFHHAVFFESAETIDYVLQHLQPFIYRTTRGKEYFFRFWDARVLLTYLSSCSTQELETFFGEIIDSIYLEDEARENLLALTINRKGKLERKLISKMSFFQNNVIPADEKHPLPGTATDERKQGSTGGNSNKRKFLMD